MTLYRVFTRDPSAAPTEPGGALYMPPIGHGRINNPSYRVLYAASHPEAAIAERFGRYAVWDSEMFDGPPGRSFGLATFSLPDSARIENLDDAARLVDLALRPSDVVTPDYETSRAWAARIHDAGASVGVSWWSWYDSRWHSYGLWNIDGLVASVVVDIEASMSVIERSAMSINKVLR